MTRIEKIRASCSIAWFWRLENWPGQPGKNCRCPFREDNKPSFSVYMAKDGERWFDHATGMKGDVIDLAAIAWDCTVTEAIERLSLLTGQAEAPRAHGQYEAAREVEWPADLRPPTELECESLGMLRQIIPNAFDLAARLGCLKVGSYGGELLWFLTDASGKGAEGKTFTGEMCLASNGQKTAALSGTKKNWPYGLITDRPEFNNIKNIVIVEGVPDYFAALQMAIDNEINFRPAAMLGANSPEIDELARPYLSGSRVIIIPHSDEKGRAAAEKWKKRIRELGSSRRDVQSLPPSIKDLNEFMIARREDSNVLLQGFK